MVTLHKRRTLEGWLDAVSFDRFEPNAKPIREVAIGIDVGWSAGTEIVLIVQYANMTAHLVQHWRFARRTLAECMTIVLAEARLFVGIAGIDPAMEAHSVQTGKSDAEVVESFDVPCFANRMDVETRNDYMRRMFGRRDGSRRILIDPACTHLAHAIMMAGSKADHQHGYDATSYGLLALYNLAGMPAANTLIA